MKRIMMILFIAAMTAVNANAQEQKKEAPKKTPEERAENMTKRMTKEFALTADQQVKVKELILKREKDREAGMQKRKEEMEKADAQFKAIFTPEQYQKFEQKKEEMKAKRKEQREHKDAPPHQKGSDKPATPMTTPQQK